MRVDHSVLPPFLPEGARVLILGSFPSVKSREEGFYYAHKSNRFFPVLATLFDEDTPLSTLERKRFLVRHKIALYDVLFSCDIENSKDGSIRDPVPIDLPSLKRKLSPEMIFTTGKAAETYFRKFFSDPCLPLPSTSAANASFSLERLLAIYRERLLPFLS